MSSRALQVLAILLLAALAALPGSVSATESLLTADTHISSDEPELNFGTRPTLNVGGCSRALIRFDPAATLPIGTPGDHVARATLLLWVNRVDVAGEIEFADVTQAWAESSAAFATQPTVGTAFTHVPVPAAGRYTVGGHD
jgi:hypothetical protein